MTPPLASGELCRAIAFHLYKAVSGFNQSQLRLVRFDASIAQHLCQGKLACYALIACLPRFGLNLTVSRHSSVSSTTNDHRQLH